MFNPVDWNSLNNSSATLASASAEGFLGPISFITLDAYSAVECNTQDCLLEGIQARPGLLLSQKAQLRKSELLKEKPWTGTIAKGSENATIRAKQGRTGMSLAIIDSCGNDDKSEKT